jgi:hypothetical protein
MDLILDFLGQFPTFLANSLFSIYSTNINNFHIHQHFISGHSQNLTKLIYIQISPNRTTGAFTSSADEVRRSELIS